MSVFAVLLAITPIEILTKYRNNVLTAQEQDYTKSRRKASVEASARGKTGELFKSCKGALQAGFSHMRRGQPGYSYSLDRDRDGTACDKVK